jgi:hypothetical protein
MARRLRRSRQLPYQRFAQQGAMATMTAPLDRRTRALRHGALLALSVGAFYGCSTDDSGGEAANEVQGEVISIGPQGYYTESRVCRGLDLNDNGIADKCECPAESGVPQLPNLLKNRWRGVSSRDIDAKLLNQDLKRLKVGGGKVPLPVKDPRGEAAAGREPVNVTVCYKSPWELDSAFPRVDGLLSDSFGDNGAFLVAAATALTGSYTATRLLNDLGDPSALSGMMFENRNIYRSDARPGLTIYLKNTDSDNFGTASEARRTIEMAGNIATRGLVETAELCSAGAPNMEGWSMLCNSSTFMQTLRHEFFHFAQYRTRDALNGVTSLKWAIESSAGAQGLDALPDGPPASSQNTRFAEAFARRPHLGVHADEKIDQYSTEPHYAASVFDGSGTAGEYRGELLFAFLKRLGNRNARSVVNGPFISEVRGGWPRFESDVINAFSGLRVTPVDSSNVASSTYLIELLKRYVGLEMPLREAYRRYALASFLTGPAPTPLTEFMPHIVTEPGLTRGNWTLQAPPATAAQNVHSTRIPELTETERYAFSSNVAPGLGQVDVAGDKLRLALKVLESSVERSEYIRIGKDAGALETGYDMPPYTFRIVTLGPGEDGKCGAGNLSLRVAAANGTLPFNFDGPGDPDFSTTDRSRDQVGWIVRPSFASSSGDRVTFTTERLYPGELPPVVGGKTFLVLTNATIRPMRVIATVDGKRGEEHCGDARIPARPPTAPSPGGATCSVAEKDWRMYTSAGIPRSFNFDWGLNGTAGYLNFKPEQLGANDRMRIYYGGFMVYDSGCAAIPDKHQVLVPLTGASSFSVSMDFNCGNVAEEIGPRSTGSIAGLKWSCQGSPPDAGAPN